MALLLCLLLSFRVASLQKWLDEILKEFKANLSEIGTHPVQQNGSEMLWKMWDDIFDST